MYRISCCIALVTALMLSGCAQWQRAAANSALESDWFALQSPASLGREVETTQFVMVQMGERSFSSINQIEWNSDRIAIAAFSHLGGALFSLTYKDGALKGDVSPMLPALFHEGFVLRDYQLAYLPLVDVQNGVDHQEYQVVDAELRRDIFSGGKKLITITYESADSWAGKVDFVNHERGYSLTFTNVENN